MNYGILKFSIGVLILLCVSMANADDAPQYHDLFNGKDLTGWVNVNTGPDTWFVRDGMIICKGLPMGVMRSEKQYENFILHIEWMHMQAGGNSGVFVWSGLPLPGKEFPIGVEVQMLELDWVNLHPDKDGKPRPLAYVHGELFGVQGATLVPDNPRGPRSKSVENRCLGKGQWNYYEVVCVDGVIKLSVNGKFVNGISKCSQRKGYPASNRKAPRFISAIFGSSSFRRATPPPDRRHNRRRGRSEVG